MAVLIGGSLVIGTGFWLAGAWPVIGFLGLDIVLLWVAFRISYRDAAAFEEVAVWPHDLVVRQVSPAGRIREHRFNPFWTRFVVRRHEEIGITEMGLQARGRKLRIGAFLNPDDRESFARAFAQALATVKR